MKKLLKRIFGLASPDRVQAGLCFLRIGVGLLTIPHGIPKMMGGAEAWEQMGVMFMQPLNIYFLPVMWGFLGAVSEFVGGILLVLGFGTRIASVFLTVMMGIATAWHIQRGDSFMVYSFPLSLMVVFIAFIIVGSGKYSVDARLAGKKTRRTTVKKHDIDQTGTQS